MVGRGRRKTSTKLIEEKTARDVCFCKRRAGLFKKARELSVLCGAKVGVLVFSRSGKPITFDASTLETLISQQLRHGSSDDIPSVESGSPPPAAGADKREALFQDSSAEKTAPFWWEKPDVASMTLAELKTFASSLSAAREERLKQLKDGDLFPGGDEPSSSINGSNEMPLMTESGQSNDEEMKRHEALLGGDPALGEDCWDAAAAGQMMDESFFIPKCWTPTSIEQMLMEDCWDAAPAFGEDCWDAAAGQMMDIEKMLMDDDFFTPNQWPPSTEIGGPQMPISFEDEPSRTDGRQLVAPTLLPCKPPVVELTNHTSFQALTWNDLLCSINEFDQEPPASACHSEFCIL